MFFIYAVFCSLPMSLAIATIYIVWAIFYRTPSEIVKARNIERKKEWAMFRAKMENERLINELKRKQFFKGVKDTVTYF